jgi:hypothetical protein
VVVLVSAFVAVFVGCERSTSWSGCLPACHRWHMAGGFVLGLCWCVNCGGCVDEVSTFDVMERLAPLIATDSIWLRVCFGVVLVFNQLRRL